MEKYFPSYEEIHQDCASLAEQIHGSGWKPDCIVAIASGGFIPARILKTFLKVKIFAVGLSRYEEGSVVREVPIKVQWLDNGEKDLRGKKVLVVDEVDDTRVTLSFCLKELLLYAPEEIRVAVLHQKKKPKLADFPSQVGHVYQARVLEDVWVKYPWDALDIAKHQRREE